MYGYKFTEEFMNRHVGKDKPRKYDQLDQIEEVDDPQLQLLDTVAENRGNFSSAEHA